MSIWDYILGKPVERIIDALIGAFLGLVVAQRPRPPGATNTNISADTVKADELNTSSMDQATVNTDSIIVDKPKGE